MRYSHPNHALSVLAIWEPNDQCQIFYLGRSSAGKIKFEKCHFVEIHTNNETNSGLLMSICTETFSKTTYATYTTNMLSIDMV